MSNAPFPPFTSPLGRLRPEGCFRSNLFHSFFHIFNFQSSNPFFFIDATIVHPHLEKFYLDRIDQVRAFPGRNFHDLVTLSRLATCGLGPVPTTENLSHEETTCRSKYRPFLFFFLSLLFFFFFFFFFFLIFLNFEFLHRKDGYDEGEQRKTHH